MLRSVAPLRPAVAFLAAASVLPAASAQTVAAPPDSLFEPLRPGESVLEHMQSGPAPNGPAVEVLVYFWGDVFRHAERTMSALDSVAAAAPEAVGADGWEADERAAFRRGFVQAAVAAAGGRAQIEHATAFTLQLTPEARRARVAALLDNRTDWLRERLVGMADFAAAAAACPDSPESAFRACLDLDEPVLWSEVRADVEAAVEALDRALGGDGPH